LVFLYVSPSRTWQSLHVPGPCFLKIPPTLHPRPRQLNFLPLPSRQH
jgi:hypothetical protein